MVLLSLLKFICITIYADVSLIFMVIAFIFFVFDNYFINVPLIISNFFLE